MEINLIKTRKFLVKNKWFLLLITFAFHFAIAIQFESIHAMTCEIITESTFLVTTLSTVSFACKVMFAFGFMFFIAAISALPLMECSLKCKRTPFQKKHVFKVKKASKRLWNFSVFGFIMCYVSNIMIWCIS